MPTYGPPSVMFVRGSGTELFDREGKRYLDLLSGLAVTSLGHSHPAVAEAISEQARTLQHVSNLFATEPQVEVAQAIDRLNGGGGQVFFCNSGAEANEAAIKLARRHGGHGRHVVVSAMRSFHGRTLATLHATGQPEKHEVFQPLPEGFRHVPFGDIDELERSIDDTCAAVLLEPVQGEGGVNPAPTGYLEAVRALCDERGMLMMMDEVQTGFGRTGQWFGYQHYGVRPDVVSMAKALGNGMPIGAIWAPTEVASSFRPGDHATTFGGQPLATSAARAVLRVMEAIDAPAEALRIGGELMARLEEVDGVTTVRGLGLLLAAQLDEGIVAGEVVSLCLQRGVVLNAVTPTSVRFAPPFTLTTEQMDEALSIFGEAIADVRAKAERGNK
ncbi:MAG: acetylornithine transaminase [Actinomycetia bacterium]|nr:acetylornithine transaminase [Actinomycetes bacterium]MCP4963244.1 acetylornithine transaminase [Actinomycetes bacterium]